MTNPTILDAIEPKVLEQMVSRRDALIRSGRAGAMATAALALGSVPLTLAATAATVGAQTPAVILDVLQYALLLENLEAEFYKAVAGTSTVAAFNTAFAPVRATITATELATLTLIRDHEIAHVTFLQAAIRGAGGTPVIYDPAATFDFTGGRGSGNGPFAAATRDKGFLLAATQGFEDTGVRAYKGQAGRLLRTDVLQPALQIHAVEARHAAKIRRMRRMAGAPNTVRYSGTVVGGEEGAAGVPTAGLPQAVIDAFRAIYAGEGNTSHTVNNGQDVIVNASSLPNIPQGANVTLAFDEALTATQVGGIIQPFIRPDVQLPASLR